MSESNKSIPESLVKSEGRRLDVKSGSVSFNYEDYLYFLDDQTDLTEAQKIELLGELAKILVQIIDLGLWIEFLPSEMERGQAAVAAVFQDGAEL